MRKIEQRSAVCLLLCAASCWAPSSSPSQFLVHGGRWVSFAANRHLYNSQGQMAVGRVLDRGPGIF